MPQSLLVYVQACGRCLLTHLAMQVCPKEVGKVYDLNNAVEVPWGDWEAAKAALDADEAALTGRFDWKFERWGPDERVGWALWEQASAFYYRVRCILLACCMPDFPIRAEGRHFLSMALCSLCLHCCCRPSGALWSTPRKCAE